MFNFRKNRSMKWLAAALMAATGCSQVNDFHLTNTWESSPSYYTPVATRIEYPTVASRLEPRAADTLLPHSFENPSELPSVELTLDEAIRMALSNGDVLRSLGGSVVNSPAGSRTQYDPAIVETNPLGGVEAALSAFDAQSSGQLFWQKNNRPNNTTFLVFQPAASQQTAATFNYELAKTTATGARFAARHVVNYDRNNNPARFFKSDFTGWFEAEYRQPLLQGSGVEFNRIAGPNSQVGQYNGVLIARINTDISLADFEQSIIQLVNDVESAYWELFFSYHNLDAQVEGRNSLLGTWQRIKELEKVGARGSDAAAESQARSQYYGSDIQVKESLASPSGFYAREQQLRYLIGLPATDGSLLKPISDPMNGEVIVDWDSALADAMTKRVEIRRQKWNIKRRELEIIAAKLNRRPSLDFLAQYRYRGLGDDLIGERSPTNSFNSLYQNILEGDYQEWQAGIEFAAPIGLRQASAAVANARWNLAREQALLDEQELRIAHDLSDAARQIRRAHELMKANFIRLQADQTRVEALRTRNLGGLDNITFLLDAQQQLANSQSIYFRAVVDYQLALRDFHREKGSLLNYNLVGMSESAWPTAAYRDAVEQGRFFTPARNPENVEAGPALSRGGFDPGQVGAEMGIPASSLSVPASPATELSPSDRLNPAIPPVGVPTSTGAEAGPSGLYRNESSRGTPAAQAPGIQLIQPAAGLENFGQGVN